MKKRTAAFLAAAGMLLLLTACGKSEETIAAEAAIESIGTVTLESEAAIDAAQKAYDALDEKQKPKVENYDKIQTSREQLTALQEEKAEADDLALAEETADLLASVAEALDARNTYCLQAWEWAQTTKEPETMAEYARLSGSFTRALGMSQKDLKEGMSKALSYDAGEIKDSVADISFYGFLQNPARGVLLCEYLWNRDRDTAVYPEDEAASLKTAGENIQSIDASRSYLSDLQGLYDTVNDYSLAYGSCSDWSGTYAGNRKSLKDFEAAFQKHYGALKDQGFFEGYQISSPLDGEAAE